MSHRPGCGGEKRAEEQIEDAVLRERGETFGGTRLFSGVLFPLRNR